MNRVLLCLFLFLSWSSLQPSSEEVCSLDVFFFLCISRKNPDPAQAEQLLIAAYHQIFLEFLVSGQVGDCYLCRVVVTQRPKPSCLFPDPSCSCLAC